jgi:uncharacterized membrane protein
MKRALDATLVALSVAVAAYAVVAYAALPLGAVLHPDLRSSFAAHRSEVVYLHVFASAAALLLGPLQFWPTLRARHPRWHRFVGRVYLGVGVGVGGVSGLLMALNAYGGPVARAGFAALSLAWIATAAIALGAVVRGDVATHRRWMTRHFALTLAAVSLRLELPLAVAAGVDIAWAYPAVAWLCWVPNLLAVEWLRTRLSPAPPEAPTAGRAATSLTTLPSWMRTTRSQRSATSRS